MALYEGASQKSAQADWLYQPEGLPRIEQEALALRIVAGVIANEVSVDWFTGN